MTKIRFKINPNQKHQSFYARSLASGMAKHGITDIHISPNFNHNEQIDLAVFWAHKQLHIMQSQKNARKPYLVMERAYIADRFKWVSLGYNGLNGRANFCNQQVTSLDRWNKHFKNEISPWAINKEGYALVIGQVPGDASHTHADINAWYTKIIGELNAKGIPVVFRKHPLARNQTWQGRGLKYETDKNEHLEDSLKGARACITFNSNSGVVSVLNGVPTISYDEGSMVYEVSSHDLADIDKIFNRDSWCAKIAYTQWLPEELENGTAWEHLRKGLAAN